MKLLRLFFTGMPKSVCIVLSVTLSTWAYSGFKAVEPVVFPVIDDFVIDDIIHEADGVRMHGTFTKVRDCQFIEAIPYSNGNRVDLRAVGYKVVSRVTGTQNWGYWLVTPHVGYLTLHFRHRCNTGLVTTLIYDGSIDHIEPK